MTSSRSNKIKVFVDCRWYAQNGQGTVTYLDGLQRAADTLLNDPTYCGPDVEFWYGVESIAETPSNLHLPHDRVVEVGRRGLLWRLFAMPFFLRRHGFDAAHFTYMCPLYSLGVTYIVSMHDVLYLRHPQYFSWGYRASRKFLYGLSARRAPIVLTISEQSRRDICELLGREAPIQLVPCAPNHTSSNSEDTTAAKAVPGVVPGRFFLSVGRVEPRKNYPALGRAFKRSGLAADRAQLVVVGFCSGPYIDEVKQLQEHDGVLWLSRVSDAELKWLYANAKAFVFPSRCEGFGIPVIEAMQAKLPVAVSDTYPVDDVLAAADIRFSPDSEEDMSNAFRGLWLSTVLHDKPPAVLARYTWENAAQAYLDALRPLDTAPCVDAGVNR